LGNEPLFAGGGNTGGVTLTNSGGAFDTCSFSVNVTAAANGTYLNTITTSYGGAYPLVSNDGNNGSATLTVASSNTPPVANDDAYSVNQDTTLNVTAPGVLANDTDADAGDTLHAVLATAPSHGSLTLNSDGSFAYVPNPGFVCQDSFTYKANDGTADSNAATVSITVNDTQGPAINVSTSKTMLWPPNHDLVDVGLTFSATDNGCTGSPTTSVAVYSTEDDVTRADGDQSPDAKGALLLRAERDARNNGRVYLIRVTSTDASNNTSHKCAAVTVPKSMSAADVTAVSNAASAAVAACTANGMFLVGDGPVIGPKQ
jgi:VCBS repeat-containing protein